MAILLNNRIPNNLDDDIEFIRKKFIEKYLRIDLSMFQVSYDEFYFTDIEKQIISEFQDGSRLPTNIDIPWMIKCFIKSTHRKKVEQGHPHWIGKIGVVVIRDLLENVDYPSSDKDKYYNKREPQRSRKLQGTSSKLNTSFGFRR